MRYQFEILNHGIYGYEVWLHGRNQGRSGVKTYCSSNLYCAPMWFDCTKTMLIKLKVDYKNSLRRFMGLLWHNSASEMFVNLNIKSFGELLRVVAIAFSTIAITHLYIISIQIAIMSIVKPCLHITMKQIHSCYIYHSMKIVVICWLHTGDTDVIKLLVDLCGQKVIDAHSFQSYACVATNNDLCVSPVATVDS